MFKALTEGWIRDVSALNDVIFTIPALNNTFVFLLHILCQFTQYKIMAFQCSGSKDSFSQKQSNDFK